MTVVSAEEVKYLAGRMQASHAGCRSGNVRERT